MRQGNIDEYSFGLGDPVTHGKIGQETVKAGGNSIESKVGEPALRVIKSLTDQPESVIMKAVILSHPPFEIPDLDSQEPRIFVGNCRIRSLPRSRVES